MKTLQERYEHELAGTSLPTEFQSGWDFFPFSKEIEIQDGVRFHLCLSHRTAQFYFSLDDDLAVYVLDQSWVKIYNSVFDLVLIESQFAQHYPKALGSKVKIVPLGNYPSISAFEAEHQELLGSYVKEDILQDGMNALYHKTEDVILVCRLYSSDKFSLSAIRYCQSE